MSLTPKVYESKDSLTESMCLLSTGVCLIESVSFGSLRVLYSDIWFQMAKFLSSYSALESWFIDVDSLYSRIGSEGVPSVS